jgi:hypothetical protein
MCGFYVLSKGSQSSIRLKMESHAHCLVMTFFFSVVYYTYDFIDYEEGKNNKKTLPIEQQILSRH